MTLLLQYQPVSSGDHIFPHSPLSLFLVCFIAKSIDFWMDLPNGLGRVLSYLSPVLSP